MSQVTFCNPVLLLDGREIKNLSNASLTFPGGNQLNSLTVNISEPDLEENNLFGKSVSFYLNYGAQDNVPIFRGYVKSASPSNNKVRINCTDVRGYIKSKEAPKIFLDDFNNYDGYSLSQFLRKYIEEKININKGKTVKEQRKETIKAIIIIKPKSIMGLISVIINDPKATIVVKVV